jgi:hypothetical protein
MCIVSKNMANSFFCIRNVQRELIVKHTAGVENSSSPNHLCASHIHEFWNILVRFSLSYLRSLFLGVSGSVGSSFAFRFSTFLTKLLQKYRKKSVNLQGLKIPQVRRPGLENCNFGLAVFPWKKPVGHAFNKIKTPHFSKRLVFNIMFCVQITILIWCSIAHFMFTCRKIGYYTFYSVRSGLHL